MVVYKVELKGEKTLFMSEKEKDDFINSLPSGTIFKETEEEMEVKPTSNVQEDVKYSEKEIKKILNIEARATGNKPLAKGFVKKHNDRYSTYGKKSGFKKPTPYKKRKNEHQMFAQYLG